MFNHLESCLKIFGIFLRFGRFYFDHFPRWGNLGLLGFCYELHCVGIGGGFQIKAKMEIIYCKKMEVYIEKSIRYTFPFIFSGFSWFQRKMQGLISFDFILEETLFTSPFSRMGLGLAMYADGGTIYFYFSLCKFSTLWQGNSENSITDIHKSILKFYLIEFTIILMK